MPSPAAPAPTADPAFVTEGSVYVSGIDALVRLLALQRQRDEAAGLRTAGFVSGYRGSPLGGLDEALVRARPMLDAHDVRFLPGINEELAATAVWGTQQLELTGGAAHVDGVFALWYGKSPGVDRCGDVFKHMSHAGTARHGGVLLVAGDDHGAYSSTLPNQSDHIFMAAMVPVLYPGSVGDYIALGLHGFAMSRFAGVPVGFKALADTVEASAAIDADPYATRIVVPDTPPGEDVNTRPSRETLGVQARQQERLMQAAKLQAVHAYARANALDRVTAPGPAAVLGIAASGKSHADVMEALDALGWHADPVLRGLVRIYRITMPWPLEPMGVQAFSHGLSEILVVEEKRSLVESQMKEQLYHLPDGARPRIVGKQAAAADAAQADTASGDWLLPPTADLSVAQLIRVIAARLARWHTSSTIRERLALLEAQDALLAARQAAIATRPAWYCAGCPHNTSTRVPDGSLALAGIGCHVMATAIYPTHNATMTHMGGEGATWLGQAWFSRRDHVFVNLGDGTYHHSGSLAIRAAVAAGVTMTYKVLYNDAVAMTGGQAIDGPIGVAQIVSQLAAEGVGRIAVVADDVSRWQAPGALPAPAGLALSVHAREALDDVQRELARHAGVSVLIYDQVCAAEKRRRQKKAPPPLAPRRAFIHEAVCEACGDCGQTSNCTAVLPVDTAHGRKRRIDQHACNTDLSCVDGFCPSIVTVDGATPRRLRPAREAATSLPEPVMPAAAQAWNVLVSGVGGTGVITVGAIIGHAARLEGRRVSVLDMTGMSQKNGAVSSHVRWAGPGADAGAAPHAARIPACGADLVLGCDLLTTGAANVLACMRAGHTRVVANSFEQPTGQFAQDADWAFPADAVRRAIAESSAGAPLLVDATGLAVQAVGDAMAANIFLLGVAYQKGLLPLSSASLLGAIDEVGVAVATTRAAFEAGRRSALPQAPTAATEHVIEFHRQPSLARLLADRSEALTAYQNSTYAATYRTFVEHVRDVERTQRGSDRLARAVAGSLFRLMAYKDEYEVARLFTLPSFDAALRDTFDGAPTLRFHFAPPLFARRDARGRPVKSAYRGSWMRPALRVLGWLKPLRGTVLDPFGRTPERREERQLIADYRDAIERVLKAGTRLDESVALALARLPERIRGFGHVKQASITAARQEWRQLMARVDAAMAGAAGAEAAAPASNPVPSLIDFQERMPLVSRHAIASERWPGFPSRPQEEGAIPQSAATVRQRTGVHRQAGHI